MLELSSTSAQEWTHSGHVAYPLVHGQKEFVDGMTLRSQSLSKLYDISVLNPREYHAKAAVKKSRLDSDKGKDVSVLQVTP